MMHSVYKSHLETEKMYLFGSNVFATSFYYTNVLYKITKHHILVEFLIYLSEKTLLA